MVAVVLFILAFLVFLIIIGCIVGLWYMVVYNSLQKARVKVQEALSGIDVALTKRYDVLVKMVDAVKGFQRYEQELLTEVIKLRTGMSMQERQAANEQMNQLTEKLNLMVENYPELKSGNQVTELQRAIVDVEEHLQAARRMYNANVSDYNAKQVMFPGNLIAKKIGATPEEFFEAEEVKRADVKIDI